MPIFVSVSPRQVTPFLMREAYNRRRRRCRRRVPKYCSKHWSNFYVDYVIYNDVRESPLLTVFTNIDVLAPIGVS